MGGDFTLFLWAFSSFYWGSFFLSLVDITTTTTIRNFVFFLLKMGFVLGGHGVYYYFSVFVFFSLLGEAFWGGRHLVLDTLASAFSKS